MIVKQTSTVPKPIFTTICEKHRRDAMIIFVSICVKTDFRSIGINENKISLI